MSRPPDPGSSEWIGQAYDAHAPALYRYALMLLRDPAAAADAVQQVFVALMRRHRAIDAIDRYLRRAVRNECVSAMRRQSRAPVETLPLEAVDPSADDPVERAAIG